MVVEFSQVSKRFWLSRTPALRGLTLSLGPGEVLGLVGRNGAGKTTSIRIGAGVCRPDSGFVEVDDLRLDADKMAASRLLGWVPEESTHDPNARVQSLLRYYASIVGPAASVRVDELLRRWGLEPFRRRRVRTLSLGMKRRLSIIASELTAPPYFLLDEVFNGLDPEAVVSVRSWIRSRRDAGCGLLLSSHNLRELATIADRVAILHEGRLLRVLDPSELTNRPSRVVRVDVPGLGDAGRTLLESFGEVVATVDGAVVRGDHLDVPAITRALVNGGYAVHGVTRENDGLEDLFLELVRGAS
ncbi:MAG: ABC transporter ATP-binding protein [Candidatus Lutacidiplasmatales archaeon]